MNKFVGREEEIAMLNKILNMAPEKIICMYGKNNCGKTTFIKEFMKRNEKVYTFYYLDFRKNYIIDEWQFLNMLLKTFYKDKKINFDKEKNISIVFDNVLDLISNKLKKVKNPVIIFDEWQNLNQLYYANKLFVDKFINYLINLTKHEHLAHVILITSDTKLIEKTFLEYDLDSRLLFFEIRELSKEESLKLIESYLNNLNLDYKPTQIYKYTGGNPALISDFIFNLVQDGNLNKVYKNKINMLRKTISFEGEKIKFYNIKTGKYEYMNKIYQLANKNLGNKKASL